MFEWILLPDVLKHSYGFHSDKTRMYVTFGIRKKTKKESKKIKIKSKFWNCPDYPSAAA